MKVKQVFAPPRLRCLWAPQYGCPSKSCEGTGCPRAPMVDATDNLAGEKVRVG